MLDIRQEKFEGPLALLLQLIEKEELDIAEISLAKIADQYIQKIKTMEAVYADEIADFLVVAAKLLLIKSRALLPYLFPEEEEEIKDLENQLRMYKEFLEASKKIETMIGKKKFMFVREWNRQSILHSAQLFSPPKKLKSEDLKMVMQDLILRLRPMEKLKEERLERKVHLEEKILHIQDMLIERIRVSFNKLLETAESRTEVVVSFLAILELIKQREIFVLQDGLFDEIFINKIQ